MKRGYTVRIPEDYVGLIEGIKMELQRMGLEVKDATLIRTLILTGIKDINMKITKGINVFDNNEGDDETDD